MATIYFGSTTEGDVVYGVARQENDKLVLVSGMKVPVKDWVERPDPRDPSQKMWFRRG